MKVGVVSDTHDHLEPIVKAVKIFKETPVQMIIHCGDWVSPYTVEFFHKQMSGFNVPIYGVIGNNPGDLKRIYDSNAKQKNPINFSKHLALEVKMEKRFGIIFHGHDKLLLQALIDSQKYDVVFTGHTHVIRNETSGKTFVFNPGSMAYASEGEIISSAAVGIYETTNNQAEVIYLD